MEVMEVIEQYLNRGFGSMNKNDFEVWIFNEWRKSQSKDLSDYQISKELKISEAKIKRLKYEADLKYSFNEVELLDKFFCLVEKAKYKKEGEKLIFVISDKLLRQYITSVLEDDGRFLESSLTSSTVSIYIDDFIFLLEKFKFNEEERKNIEELVLQKEENNDFQLSFSEIIKSFLEDVGNKYIGAVTTATIKKYLETKLNHK